MTIALGLMARDGLVIAADTEETRGNMKVHRGKLSSVFSAVQDSGETRFRQCVVAGAGDGTNIDGISQKLIRCVYDGEAKSDNEISNDFERIHQEFYGAHVLPFALYPEEQRPDFELLIGVQLPDLRLLLARGNTLIDAGSCAAIGIGTIVADQYLSRFYRLPLLDVCGTVFLASYIMCNVKDSVVGCGKATDIVGVVGMKNGRFFRVARNEAAKMEEAMREFGTHVEPALFREIGGIDSAQERESGRKARLKLRRIMNGIRATLKPLKPPRARH